MDPPPGSLGCQKMHQDPLNMPLKVWCANIAPKLKNNWNTLRKQGFFDIYFQFWWFFEVCAFIGQKLNTFICKKNLIIWHPWDPWEQIHIDLNKNSVRTGCVPSWWIQSWSKRWEPLYSHKLMILGGGRPFFMYSGVSNSCRPTFIYKLDFFCENVDEQKKSKMTPMPRLV